MDNQTNVKQEAPPPDDDLPCDEALFISTTACVNEFGMDNKNIKVETNVSDIKLQTESQYFYKHLERDFNDDLVTSSKFDCKTNSKVSIKEEPDFSGAGPLNVEYLNCVETILGSNFKMDSEIKCEMEEFVSDATSQNKKRCFSVEPMIKKDTVICSDRGIGTFKGTEIEWQSQTASDPDISCPNENEENVLGAPEDLSGSQSPRFTAKEAIYHASFHTYPDASKFKNTREKNTYKEAYMNYSTLLNCDAVCDSKHLESGQNVSEESKLTYENSINRQQVLNRYSLCHSELKCYKCEICENCFTKRSTLVAHTILHSGTKPYKCEHCEKCFSRKSYLETHVLIHSGIKPYKCEDCEKCFLQKAHLKTHLLSHSGTKPHKCEHCEKCFSRKGNLKTHSVVHSGERAYKCENCEKSFLQKAHLKSHAGVHLDTLKIIHSGSIRQKAHKCEHCDRYFVGSSDLHGQISMRCSICSLQSTCDAKNVEPEESVGDENKLICEKNVNREQVLNRHSLCDSQPKSYKCEVCKKCFTQRSSLNTHKLLHSGIKPYKCEHCEKCFSRKAYLITHILVHSGTKAYKCERCEKCFSQKAHLKTHKLVHSGTKPYKCEHCDKCFSRKGNLKTHSLVHSGTKAYKCEHCKRCFSQKAHLKTHSLVHSGLLKSPYTSSFRQT